MENTTKQFSRLKTTVIQNIFQRFHVDLFHFLSFCKYLQTVEMHIRSLQFTVIIIIYSIFTNSLLFQFDNRNDNNIHLISHSNNFRLK